MAWSLPRDLRTHIDDVTDPTGVPASALVALVLVLLLLTGLGAAVRWSVDGIGEARQVAVVQE